MRGSDYVSFLVSDNLFPDRERAEVRSEISFAEAIAGHQAWRQCVIDSALGKSETPMSCLQVCDESGCPLGRWIAGAGQRRYGDLHSFAELKEQHSRFHQCACEIIELAVTHRRDDARQLIEGEFLRISSEIVARMRHLEELFRD